MDRQIVNSRQAAHNSVWLQVSLVKHLTIKSFLFAMLCLGCIAPSYGQAKNSYAHVVVEITKQKGNISTKVEVKSAFPGGDSLWVRSLEKKLDEAIRAGKRIKKGKYIVSVKFIVRKDRTVSDVLCETDPGFGLCDKVVRAVGNSPRWGTCSSPAKKNE